MSNMNEHLVRESDRKPGSYVLSYLGKTGINHFRYVIEVINIKILILLLLLR